MALIASFHGNQKLLNRGGKCPENKGHRTQQNRAKQMLSDLPTPCFNFSLCHGMAALAKNGKGVCWPCAEKMTGVEYLYEKYQGGAVEYIHQMLTIKGMRPAE